MGDGEKMVGGEFGVNWMVENNVVRERGVGVMGRKRKDEEILERMGERKESEVSFRKERGEGRGGRVEREGIGRNVIEMNEFMIIVLGG